MDRQFSLGDHIWRHRFDTFWRSGIGRGDSAHGRQEQIVSRQCSWHAKPQLQQASALSRCTRREWVRRRYTTDGATVGDFQADYPGPGETYPYWSTSSGPLAPRCSTMANRSWSSSREIEAPLR